MNTFITLIVAAGLGTRTGSKTGKQFLNIDSKPLIFYSLDFFLKNTENDIFLVLSEQGITDFNTIPVFNKFDKTRIKIISGGRERSNSVFNGLSAIKKAGINLPVLIHDGARPFLNLNVIINLLKEIKIGAKAVIPVLPVVDTICEISSTNRICSFPQRSKLNRVQTPQVFDFNTLFNLLDSLIKNNMTLTDESSLFLNSPHEIQVFKNPGSADGKIR